MYENEKAVLKAAPNTEQIINDLTEKMVNDFTVEEQKHILSKIKSNISMHYEELRQKNLKSAEDYSKRIEFLQS